MAGEEPAGRAAEPPVTEASSSSAAGRRRFGFRRGGSEGAKRPGDKPVSGTPAPGSVSPMEFWRRGSARSARPTATSQRKLGVWQRITGLHFPAWVPVVAIIFVVFGILFGLFFLRSAAGAPRIGKDHWHARYEFTLCGQRQPNAPEWHSGVHTHADGIIHIHPFTASEEGSGARLVKWFEYGNGKLTSESIRMPGSSDEHKNGDKCTDGSEGKLQIFVTTTASGGVESKLDNVDRYIPHDGDRIRIVFGPVEAEPVRTGDRTIISPDLAKKTIEVTVSDDGTEAGTSFQPNRIPVDAGEVVKVVVKNTGQISHGFRVRGGDGAYETSDDFVVTPDGQDATISPGILQPGTQGSAIIRLDTQAEIEFRDETLQNITGTIVVGAAPAVTASPTPAPEAVDFEVAVTMKDNSFEPANITVPAGKKFRIKLTNEGPTFAHNLHIAGPDGQFGTSDDLKSNPNAQRVGQPGELVGQLDTPGTYDIKSDFQEGMTGTITVTPP